MRKSEPVSRPKESTSISQRRARVDFTFHPSTPDEEPPLSTRMMRRIRAKVSALAKPDVAEATNECKASECAQKTGQIKNVADALSGLKWTCRGECVTKLVGNKWVKVCHFACRAKRLTMEGEVKQRRPVEKKSQISNRDDGHDGIATS